MDRENEQGKRRETRDRERFIQLDRVCSFAPVLVREHVDLVGKRESGEGKCEYATKANQSRAVTHPNAVEFVASHERALFCLLTPG